MTDGMAPVPGILYHLCRMEDVPGILEKGLLPDHGANAGRIRDNREPAVCMTDQASAGLWGLMLGRTCMLAVDVSRMTGLIEAAENRNTGAPYREYRCGTPIGPEHICSIPMDAPEPDRKQLLNLRMSQLSILNALATSFIQAASGAWHGYDREDLAARVDASDVFSRAIALDRPLYGLRRAVDETEALQKSCYLPRILSSGHEHIADVCKDGALLPYAEKLSRLFRDIRLAYEAEGSN